MTSTATPSPRPARSLGLTDNLICSWKHALERKGTDALPGKGELPAVEDELRRLRAENQRLRAERDILKSDGVLRQGGAMTFRFIEEHRKQWPVRPRRKKSCRL